MGLIMSANIKFLYIILSTLVFIVLPLLFFFLGDFPKKTLLKDSISIITILAFFILISQFYLSKINEGIVKIFKTIKVIKIHKIIGYVVLPIFLIHPFLIVLPRFFEVGPSPFESFITLITSFDKLGVFLGIVSWILMLALGLTSLFRNSLNISYKSWKLIHGLLSFAFIILASWHAITLGKHMSNAMITLIIVLSSIASILIFKNYFVNIKRNVS